MISRPKTSSFRGLNNVADPLRLNLGWLTRADNVDVTDHQQLVRCRGFTKRTSNSAITGAYTTQDLLRMYVVDSGQLRQMNADFTYTVLRTGLASAPMRFTEIAGKVFYTNGVDFGLLEPDAARAWGVPTPVAPRVSASTGTLDPGVYEVVCTLTDDRGMEGSNSFVAPVALAARGSLVISSIPQVTGYTTNVYVTQANGTVFFLLREAAGTSVTFNAGDPLGVELPFWNVNTPRGTHPAFFQGRLYCGEYFPQTDLSVIWRSLPLHYHHFDPGAEGIAVPGVLRMLEAPEEGGLIIGTDRSVDVWDGERLTRLADYGVVPGYHAARLDKKLYFWTLRGLARAMPFENLTESTVSVAPGLSAGATVMARGGHLRYVVALQKGGAAFNAYPAL